MDLVDHNTIAILSGRFIEKLGATRMVKEWRKATAAGDTDTAGQLAGASHQLGLKPRYLEDISSGGSEASVDKMMGHVMGPNGETNQGGLVARKLYKPDSIITRGADTSELLRQKQTATDQARALSPEAKAMVPSMYGHSELSTPGGLRHTSMHEYVPGVQDLRKTHAPEAVGGELQRVKDTVVNPMIKNHGTIVGDTVKADQVGHVGFGYNKQGFNPGNVVSTPKGTKILDFLPDNTAHSSPIMNSMQQNKGLTSGQFDSNKNLTPIRKEVFRGQTQFTGPNAPGAKAPHLPGFTPAPMPAGFTPAPTAASRAVAPTAVPTSAKGQLASMPTVAKPVAPAATMATSAAAPKALGALAPAATKATAAAVPKAVGALAKPVAAAAPSVATAAAKAFKLPKMPSLHL